MKIAIIGSGISGMTAAYLLHDHHEITLFEAAPYIGGHTRTETVHLGNKSYHIDTGFIVYNEKTYPHFTRLLKKLNVPTKATEMSFGVKDKNTGIEYRATNLSTLFANRKNIFKPEIYKIIYDILRFNNISQTFLENPTYELTLGEFLVQNNFSNSFKELFILPMGGAIWSTSPETMLDFPALFFIRFFHNHGFLNRKGQPIWRVIEGGSKNYIPYLTKGFKDSIKLSTPVLKVRRESENVRLETQTGGSQFFDHVIFATHSDQALKILENPHAEEKQILQSLPYQPNEAILHTDINVLPENPKARASWNVYLYNGEKSQVTVSYWMNRLQGLDVPHPFIVSLNCKNLIDPEKIIKTISFDHPLFTCEGMKAQENHPLMINRDRISFCGAYWRNGFHEDGVVSALSVAQKINPQIMI